MTERAPMLAIVCAVLLVTSSGAPQNAPPVNNRANPYALVRNWPQLPEGRTLGGVSGVDIDRDGSSVWIAERCGGNACTDSTVSPILKFDTAFIPDATPEANPITAAEGVAVDAQGNIYGAVVPTPSLLRYVPK